ncbi:MAG: hypothetical protein ACOYXM_17380 [Actinomycetota bacterium]
MRRIKPAVLATPLLLALLVTSLAACGGGETSRADVEADIATQLEDEGLDADQSACFAELIVDEVGLDNVKDIDFSAEEPPAELEDELTSAAVRAGAECELDLGSFDE